MSRLLLPRLMRGQALGPIAKEGNGFCMDLLIFLLSCMQEYQCLPMYPVEAAVS